MNFNKITLKDFPICYVFFQYSFTILRTLQYSIPPFQMSYIYTGKKITYTYKPYVQRKAGMCFSPEQHTLAYYIIIINLQKKNPRGGGGLKRKWSVEKRKLIYVINMYSHNNKKYR